MPTLAHKDIAQSIYDTLKDKDAQEEHISLRQVVQFLYKKQLLSKSSQILEQLQRIINEDKGVLEVKVTSTEFLAPQIKEELTHFIKQKYGAREVEVIDHIDQRLIGGMRIEVNNEVIDMSLKNKIAQLQEHLMANI